MKRLLAMITSIALVAPGNAFSAEEVTPFFAFDNGTGRGKLSPEDQASMLDELGYAGIGYTGAQGIPETLAALDKHGLKMFSIYVGVHLGPNGPTIEPHLKEGIAALKGRKTIIWLYINGHARNAHEQAVDAVRKIADLAEGAGLRVALYPHAGFHVAKVEDALRIVKDVDRKNVGASFNLCHWLRLDDERNMEPLIQAAAPHLFLVSINGADSRNTKRVGGRQLIQTLDQGSFDVGRFLDALKRAGYNGPVGLQCYAIKGDVRDNLKRSMDAWKKIAK